MRIQRSRENAQLRVTAQPQPDEMDELKQQILELQQELAVAKRRSRGPSSEGDGSSDDPLQLSGDQRQETSEGQAPSGGATVHNADAGIKPTVLML
jgi:hypothetical protein